MMKKVFWDNPYQTELNATVSSVQDDKVMFDETIIYSFVGGQESDKATVNGIPVVHSVIEGFNIRAYP